MTDSADGSGEGRFSADRVARKLYCGPKLTRGIEQEGHVKKSFTGAQWNSA